MSASRVVTASILVAHGNTVRWAQGGGEVVERSPDRLTLAYRSVTDAVAAGVSAARAGAAVGMAVGEVSRTETWWAGPPLQLAAALAERASDGSGAGRILATAVVESLGSYPGVRCVPVGGVALGQAGVVDCVEVLTLMPESGPVSLDVPLPTVLTLGDAFPFVARPEPWGQLEQAWTAATTGARQVVLLAGEAGTGKTRLLGEFARSVHAQGGLALYGTCSDPMSIPYQPFGEAFEQLVATLDAPGLADLIGDREVSELARFVPGLADRVEAPSPAGKGDPEAERLRLFHAVMATLDATTRHRPVLLVLDDLHWASRPTVRLLGHLTRSPALAYVCIAASYRSSPIDLGESLKSLLSDLRRQSGVTRLELGGFDEAGVRHFVEAAAGHELGRDLEEVVETLTAQTDGNAFLLGELWRHLVDTGYLAYRNGSWEVTRPLTEVASPAGVRDVVEARLDRLPDDTRQLLGVAAVIGAAFRVEVLTTAVERDTRSLLGRLDPALRAGLIEEGGVGEYRFTHALSRRAVYDGLSPGERRCHHFDIARALERVHGDRAIAEIAHHTAAAVPVADPGAAVAVARRAAEAAQNAAAYDDAARHLETVLSIAPPGGARCELLLELADANVRAGDVATAEARCLEASDLASRLQEPSLVVTAALAYGEVDWKAAFHGGMAEQLLRDALPVAEHEAVRLQLRAALSRALVLSGKRDEGQALGKEALAAARELDDPETLRVAFRAALSAPATPDNLDDHVAVAREFSEFARASGVLEDEAWALNRLLSGTISIGDLEEARALAVRLRDLVRQSGQPLFRALDLQTHALLAIGQGRFVDAEAMATEANEISVTLSGGDAPGGYGVQLFSIRREQGRLDEARPIIEAIARLGQQGDTWRPALAVLYADLGLTDEAAEEVRHLVEDGLRAVPRDALWLASLSYLADACVAVGAAEAASVVYRELLPHRGLIVQVEMLLAAYGATDRYLGALAALLGRGRDAETHFEAALRIDTQAQMPVWLAHTQLAYGQFLMSRARRGDFERATALLHSALEIAQDLGVTPVAAGAIAALDRVAGARPTLGGDANGAGITERELAVLRLLVEGHTNREIGERLHISQHTAANHVRSILLKTACVNRTEAAAWALRRGLVVV